MPGFNGRGPEGAGPQTGRGLGRCKPSNVKESLEKDKSQEEEMPERGRGMGLRRGNGAGRGNGGGRGLGRGGGRGQGRGFGK